MPTHHAPLWGLLMMGPYALYPHTLIEMAQPFLEKAVEWGAQNGLTFSALKAANYPSVMIRWYMNFLKTRESIADVLGVKTTIQLACGTP